MKFHCVAALTALVAVSSPACAETCSLGQMASLDMTVLSDGRVTVPVTINGTEHKFLVDTAGVFSEIGAGAAQKLGLKEVPAKYEMYDAGGKLRVYSATVDSFKVGNNEARHFHLGVRHAASQQDQNKSDQHEDEAGFDGLLAPDFLSLFDIEFDFGAKKMNLFSQDHCPGKVVYWTRNGYAELPFRYTSGALPAAQHIQLNMALDGHDISVSLDTGSANSWIRKKSAVQVLGIDENSPGVSKSPYSAENLLAYRKQFVSLTLGGLAVQNPVVDILPSLEDDAFRMEHSEKSRDDPVYGNHLQTEQFILGMNVIDKLHLYIAYREHKIYVTAADAH